MKKEKERRQILRTLGLLTQLGVSMAVCVGVGVLAGKLLDRLLGTSPWLLIACAFIGAAAAFRTMYQLVMKEWM